MADTYKNLTELLALMPDDKKPIAKKLITELNFMKSTLTDLRKYVKANGAVENFKNGKQEMLRESPALKAYNTTARQYAAYYKQLTDLLPKDTAPATRGGGALEQFLQDD